MKKGLTIISVLMMIFGILTLAVGVVTIVMFLVSGQSTTEVHALIGLAFIFAVVNGLLEFFGGYLGIRAAKNPRKSLDAVIFGFVMLAVGVASLVLDFNISNILACVLPLLYFICAMEVSKGAKRSE